MKDCQSKSDREIVKLSIKDSEYFACLVERYEGKLLRYILRLSSVDHQTAEDILQEVFIKVYRNINDYDESFSFSSWIYRITHNEVIDHVRKLKARPKVVSLTDNKDSDNDIDRDFIDLIPDETDLPKQLARKELAHKMHEAVLSLPIQYQDVLILRYLEEKSYAEISDILKKSVGNVSVLLNRAKKYFKKNLKSLNL